MEEGGVFGFGHWDTAFQIGIWSFGLVTKVRASTQERSQQVRSEEGTLCSHSLCMFS